MGMEAFSDMGDDIDDFFDFSNESIIEDEEWGAAVEEGGILVMGSSAPNYYHTEQPSAVLDNEELYMPCEDVAHLEWLSNFVEESMSSSIVDESLAGVISNTNINGKEVNQNTIINNLISNTNANANSTSGSGFGYGYGFSSSSSSSSSSSLRRNRLRLWESQVILIDTARADSPVKPVLFDSPSSTSTLTDSEDELTSSKKKKKKNQSNQNNQKKVVVVVEEERNMARKCQHCGSTKTPQWRAGPKGPKTLCNACGVRYKSGRLLPQYRPASSPSFNTTLHSNSHRRVLEMQTLLQKGEEEEEEEGTGS